MAHAKYLPLLLSLTTFSLDAAADNTNSLLRQELKRLQHQTALLEKRLNELERHPVAHHRHQKIEKHRLVKAKKEKAGRPDIVVEKKPGVHNAPVELRSLNHHPESVEFYPTALISEGHVATYIAGTPVVTVPYLGSRPNFDGSDYIINTPSINRDVRLMEQRRRLYRGYEALGYPLPNTPIIALSGKVEPIASMGNSFRSTSSTGTLDLSSAELNTTAALNENVEAFIALAYAPSSDPANATLVSNSEVDLGSGFLNIGNLDKTPWYLTAGQLFVPFGRYSSGMVSAPLPMLLGRTKARPFMVGYKSQGEVGPFATVYAFSGDTTVGNSGVGGANFGYNYAINAFKGEVGASYINSINDAGGMQDTNTGQGLFGGFGSFANGSEAVRHTPAVDVHGNIRFDRYILTAEWVGATEAFRPQDLSYNGLGARPQAGQLEAGLTFDFLNKPSSFNLGYQWTTQALALNLPKQRYSGTFSMSWWQDTVESLEYDYNLDYGATQFANGAAPIGLVNANTLGTGRSSSMVLARIGVYF